MAQDEAHVLCFVPDNAVHRKAQCDDPQYEGASNVKL